VSDGKNIDARDEREAFETHIKRAAWYGVLSQAANDDDDGASVFRMARMAASEAWQARAALTAKSDAAAGEPVGVVAHDPVERGYHMEALISWDDIPVGAKLYLHPVSEPKAPCTECGGSSAIKCRSKLCPQSEPKALTDRINALCAAYIVKTGDDFALGGHELAVKIRALLRESEHSK
jgi:hypothetical protein